MSEPQNDNAKNKPPQVGDMDVSKIDDKAGMHSSSESARHIERAQEKQVQVIEGNETGSWQIKDKEEI